MTQPSKPYVDPSPAGRSTELPVVVIGEEGGRVKPAVRLLPGRVDVSHVLYPTYLLIIGAGSLAVNFAVNTGEWSAPVVALGWGLLFAWHWVYGVTYRYRRWLLKSFTLLVSLFMGLGLSFLAWERAQPQEIPVAGSLVMRGQVTLLEFVWLATAMSSLLLILHVLVLGRGYREKRLRVKERKAPQEAGHNP
ncbi:MAG: hypothetical protein ACNA8W_01570 [Bradymonadaceae bacterium]